MHGHNHIEGRIELGYAISTEYLNKDSLFESPALEKSSVKYGALHNNVSFDMFIRGKNSLGQLLQDQGYNTIPPFYKKQPGIRGICMNGGHCIKKYGSSIRGKIDAVQIETHINYRNNCTMPSYAKALAQAIHKFIGIYYQ